MPEGQDIELEPNTETRKITSLVEKYKDKLGSYDVVSVGEAGFLLQSERQKPMAGNDWFLFDYDDTLVETTQIKLKRLALYKDYARSVGISASDEELARIVKKTDEFARWEDREGGGASYHANSHMSSLDWATNELKKIEERKNHDENVSTQNEIERIEQTLDRIKEGLDEDTTPEDTDPFYLRKSDKKMVLKGKVPWSKDIENIFMQTMINPPSYTESMEAVSDIGRPTDSIHRVNLGILTYGQPYYQLLKVFELMEKNPEMPISQIWLSGVPKGKFIEEMVKTKATQKTKLDYVPAGLGDTEGDTLSDSMSYGSGYPLGNHPHAVVVMDDSPKELSSILGANEYLKDNTGASFVVVRSRRSGTREEEKEFEVKTPYGEIDFRGGAINGKEVVKILQVNRYLGLKAKLGENDPQVKAMAGILYKLGVGEKELQGVL